MKNPKSIDVCEPLRDMKSPAKSPGKKKGQTAAGGVESTGKQTAAASSNKTTQLKSPVKVKVVDAMNKHNSKWLELLFPVFLSTATFLNEFAI